MKETMSFDKMMDIMRNNFEHMQNSPLVKSLRKENRKLAKENKLLMSIIKNFHISNLPEKTPVVVDLSGEDNVDVPPVKIKIENEEKTNGNIVYELIEKEEKSTTSTVDSDACEEGEGEEDAGEEVEVEVEVEGEEEGEEEEGEEGEEEEEEGEEEEELPVSPSIEREEEETEVYEVLIRGKKYYTSDQKNGKIYSVDKDGEVGDEVGQFVNGVAKI
jgi:hypothetical protein